MNTALSLSYSVMHNWKNFQLCLIKITVQLVIELVILIEMFTGFSFIRNITYVKSYRICTLHTCTYIVFLTLLSLRDFGVTMQSKGGVFFTPFARSLRGGSTFF